MSTHYKVGVTQSAPRAFIESIKHQSSTYTCFGSAIKKHAISASKRIIRHDIGAHHGDTQAISSCLTRHIRRAQTLRLHNTFDLLLYVWDFANLFFSHQLAINLALEYQICLIYQTSQQQTLLMNKHTSELKKSSLKSRRESGRAIFGILLTRVLKSESSCSRLILLCLLWLLLVWVLCVWLVRIINSMSQVTS